ncbi:MAG: c-type cytochrome [Fidelibacterota bacterium]
MERVKKLKSFFLAIPLVVISFLPLSGCSEKGDYLPKNPESKEKSFALREGARLYRKYCSACHAIDGGGGGRYFAYNLKPGPPDFTSPEFFTDRDDRYLLEAIKGSRKNRCPPWGNTFLKDEIEYIIEYIKLFSRGK